MSTATLIQELKDNSEDFEWYPTTTEIIACLCKDLFRWVRNNYSSAKLSLLDIGAGDGRVLTRLQENVQKACNTGVDMYAIEISTIHLNNMPKEVVVVGTDFMEQSMVDKRMDIAFCNPPYSEYETWATKLIRECAVKQLYLVIPQRWKDVDAIKDAVKLRGAEVEVLGSFDFENADRRARAKVNLLKVEFPWEKHAAFDAAIESMLPELQMFDRADDLPEDPVSNPELILSGDNLIDSLVMAYDGEIEQLIATYKDLVKLKPRLLKELGVDKANILQGVRTKIKGLKEKYWKQLFDRCKPITKRLATKQRKEFLDSLQNKSVIDFTASNIYATLIWVTKWSNDYFDTQLIEMYTRLAEYCNVVNYKSNAKVWTQQQWRYGDMPAITHYKLEYRLVLERCGGINTSSYSWEAHNGLDIRSVEFMMDCITVANNLGFDCEDSPLNYQWSSNKQHTFKLVDGKPLAAVRAFKNKNIHMHWSPQIMLAINVEAGRLLGWLRTPEQAAAELGATKEEEAIIHQVFNSNLRIGKENILRLTG